MCLFNHQDLVIVAMRYPALLRWTADKSVYATYSE